jgi:hypothetical protein
MVTAVGGAFATGLLVVLMVVGCAVPVLMVLRAWLADGTLGGGPALGIIAGLFFGLFAMWHAQGTVWMFLWVAAVIAGCAALPLLSGEMNKRALREMAQESIERYRGTLARDPRNAGAHAYLADAYMDCGRIEEAITSYRRAIELDPDHTRRERSKLQKALEVQEGRERPSILVCDRCHGETPAREKVCAHCGATLRMSFFEWLAQPESMRAVTRQTVMVMLVITVLYTLFSTLPLEVKGCVLIATIMVGGFYFLRAIQG